MENKQILTKQVGESAISNMIIDEFTNNELNEKLEWVHKELYYRFWVWKMNKVHDELKSYGFIPIPYEDDYYLDDHVPYCEIHGSYNCRYPHLCEMELCICDRGMRNPSCEIHSSNEQESSGIHQCIIDGSDCGVCRECRYDMRW